MFNTTNYPHAAPAATLSATLFTILEALLCVQMRDELVAENSADQADGAYQYGL